MNHAVRPILSEDRFDRLGIADVMLLETRIRELERNRRQRSHVARISKLVDNDYIVLQIRNEMTAHGRSDEAGASSYNYPHP